MKVGNGCLSVVVGIDALKFIDSPSIESLPGTIETSRAVVALDVTLLVVQACGWC
jgi:hypothetical protein